jgi:lipopolysaccharide biosynthesis glycosyltransferase
VHCHRVDAPQAGKALGEKNRMAAVSPFQSTLYLDVDTVVAGNLEHAFRLAERHGLACALNECPWMRRYQQPGEEEQFEYNTGVIFFTQAAAPVFDAWQRFADTPSASLWTTSDNQPRGLTYDDQASFARAIRHCEFNPAVLPVNYNFRPHFFRSGFAPIKIWHDYVDPPPDLLSLSLACERGARPVTYFELNAAPRH